MRIRNLNRWQAFAGHLSFSLLLGLAVFVLFRYLWYPDALFTLAGAGKLMLLVVGIDVTLGPLLTLVVFNPRKKSLIWDLSAIIALQVGALGYGVWVVAQSRPVFLVGAVDRFELVTANMIHPTELAAAAQSEWQSLSWRGPVVVGTKPPENVDERLRQALDALNGGPEITQLPRYFVPLESISATLLKAARPLASFDDLAPTEIASLRSWLQRNGRLESDVAVLPLKARFGIGAILIDRTSAKPLVSATFDGYAKPSNGDHRPTDSTPSDS